MSSQDLADKSVSNIFWSFVSFAGAKLIGLATIIFLARHLSPAEFGLMALCIVIIGYFEIVARFGLGQALISRIGDLDEAADAVFFFSVGMSALMAAALWLSAPKVAAFFEQPELAPLLRVICLGLVIQSLSTVPANMLRRELKFRRKAVPDLVHSVVKGLVSIALAVAGFGVWSLVWGYLAGAVVEMIVRFAMYPWRPKGLPRRRVGGQMTHFGMYLLLAESINALQRTLDALIIGKLLGPAAMGLYSHAFKIPDLAVRSLNQVAGIVIHPVMSGIQTDMTALRAYYYACFRYVALFTFPISVAIAILADPLVRVLYTPAWLGMIAPMQYLAISVGIMTADFLPGVIYKAINRPAYMTFVSAVKLPFFAVTLWYFGQISLEAVSAAQIGLGIFYMLLNLLMLRHVVEVAPRPYFASLVPGVAVSSVVAGAGLAVRAIGIAEPLLETAVLMAAMGGAYLAAVQVMSPEVFREGLRMLGGPNRKRGSGLPAA